MDFYESISDYYHHIFPLNKVQVNFVQSSLNETSQKDLLDIGCGIGELSLELSNSFKSVHAIDLDEAMIQKAQKTHQSDNLHFMKLNMLKIEEIFRADSFDAIVCFGNTLVHLNGPDQMLEFFKQSRKVLKSDGKLLLQIINYDRIIDQKVKALPTIENDNIKFIRNYHYDKKKHMISFETQLLLKETGQKIKNTVQLYPLQESEIGQLLTSVGYTEIKYFGNFKKDDLKENSIPLIVEAKK